MGITAAVIVLAAVVVYGRNKLGVSTGAVLFKNHN